MIYATLYTIGAVFTYGWAMALDVPGQPHIRDFWDVLICAAAGLLWPVSVPLIVVAGRHSKMPLWCGWRLR
jgi:hypothetical protein